jgi:transposase-like protein
VDRAAIEAAPSHSFNFDQRRRPEALRTAMATAFFCPTNTTKRLPRVAMRRIVKETRQPGSSVSRVARWYGTSPGVLF